MSTPEVRRLILNFPAQIHEGIRAAEIALKETRLPNIPRKTSHLIFCGMGGSALPALIVRSLLEHDRDLHTRHLHAIAHRDYGLPKDATNAPSTIFITSYSGNTEEALSAYVEARKHRLPLFAITSGGTLALWAQRDRVPVALIQRGAPPRFAVPQQLSAFITFLVAKNFLPKRLSRDLRDATRAIRPAELEPKGKVLAQKLRGRIPLIYTSEKNAAIAYILKIQINENTKIPAFTNVFPEFNHNEFNTFAQLSQKQRAFRKSFVAVFLDDALDAPIMKQRMQLTASCIKKAKVSVVRIPLSGRTLLHRTLVSLIFGEWASTRLATLYGIDPLPTDLTEQFKRRLRK